MIVFVTGGSGCGKSAFAESAAVRLAKRSGSQKIYVATMPVFSAEDERKVARHHRLRAGKGFETLERPKRLSAIPDGGETVLIECMSTHTANLLYDPEICLPDDPDGERTLAEIRDEISALASRSGDTVFVSAEVGFDGSAYDAETERYRRVLTGVNRFLAAKADAVFEVVCGIALLQKGEFDV